MMDTLMQMLWFLVGCGLLVSTLRSVKTSSEHQEQIDQLERKVDFLFGHLGLAYDHEAVLQESFRTAVREGRKVDAIKMYREMAGADLKEAKDYVEDMLNQEAKG